MDKGYLEGKHKRVADEDEEDDEDKTRTVNIRSKVGHAKDSAFALVRHGQFGTVSRWVGNPSFDANALDVVHIALNGVR